MKDCETSILGIRNCSAEEQNRCLMLINDQINDGEISDLKPEHFDDMPEWAMAAYRREIKTDSFWPQCAKRASIISVITSALIRKK